VSAGGASGGGGGSALAGTGPVSGGAGSGIGGATGGVTGAAGGAGLVAGAGSGGGSTAITVALDQTDQTIEGFGINDTYEPSAFSSTVAESLFTTTASDGIGLSMLRIGMSDQGTDQNKFESTNISAATSHGAKIIGSCWSPPKECKTNNNVNDGGHLISNDNGKCYGSWSDTIVSWAKGHDLYAMSIGNEPDFASCGTVDPCNGNYPSTLYTANEMVAWVKVAGPKLQAAGIKVIAPEASEWNHAWSNTSAGPDVAGKNSSDPLKCGFPSNNPACDTGDGYDYGHWLAKDEMAWGAFDVFGVHEYDSQVATAWPGDLTVKKKEVWQTEMSGVKYWPEQGPSSDINNAVVVAGWIHSALVVGEASTWFWWWYTPIPASSNGTNDNEGLVLQDQTAWTKRYYALGNYSKFVRPGYVRVEVTGNVPSNVLLSAYKGSDGTLVVVAINDGTTDVSLPIAITGGTAPASLTPTVTSANDNLASKPAVAVTSGSFMAALGAKTVTTFVGK
jgi:glucuronoarabinoxylan endo-1,4-beta-xylanase